MKVYLIECTLYGEITYKIGKTSRSTIERLLELSTGNAGDLRVVCEYDSKYGSLIEIALHNQYSHRRLSGEWFNDITPSEFLNSCQIIDDNIKKLKNSGNPFI